MPLSLFQPTLASPSPKASGVGDIKVLTPCLLLRPKTYPVLTLPSASSSAWGAADHEPVHGHAHLPKWLSHG